MNINVSWHLEHPMPQNPTFEQKVEWHLEHQKNCACRPISKKLADEMAAKGIKFEPAQLLSDVKP
ncbi:MAG: hypothetical protein M3O71_06370 [Bacteroidota bacterium]|nr:hypothetical protein [Bacteroidota bacterium]